MAVVYAIAHYTYGPSSPEKLEATLQAAVDEHNVDKLADYLSDENADLTTIEKLDAFKQAFNDDTAANYKKGFKEALLAEQQFSKMNEFGIDWGDEGTIVFVKESNWRGTKWSYTIKPSSVTFEQQPEWTVVTSLATLPSNTGTLSIVWPAVYEYKSEVSNKYGGTQTIQGSVDLFHNQEATVSLTREVQAGITFLMPQIDGVGFTLNGVDFPALEEGQTRVRIAPVPAELKVAAKGTLLGRTIDITESVNGSENEEVNLSTLVSQAIAEDVAEVILNANVSWTKAKNAGTASLLTDIDPNSPIMSSFSQGMYEGGTETKVHLERIAIDPMSIEIYSDRIQVTAEEEYSYPGSTLSNNISSNTYTITKRSDTNGLWLTETSRNYFWSSDLLERNTAMIKTNPEKPVLGDSTVG
ncbi:hypothetical protein [Paenibacillus cellulosilyticus]|uniref:hypothetical protein n=1 Tax=Paenibacillus cellulosilyticus TaxID=375489 RepID=UPI001FEBE4DC|nr:hypothetical protein [Paenibacillus cellulosilyticus]